jgi:primary-amine oxidase
VSHIGFKLKPAGFFDGNPALDLPPSESAHCAHHGHGNGNGNGSGNGHYRVRDVPRVWLQVQLDSG